MAKPLKVKAAVSPPAKGSTAVPDVPQAARQSSKKKKKKVNSTEQQAHSQGDAIHKPKQPGLQATTHKQNTQAAIKNAKHVKKSKHKLNKAQPAKDAAIIQQPNPQTQPAKQRTDHNRKPGAQKQRAAQQSTPSSIPQPGLGTAEAPIHKANKKSGGARSRQLKKEALSRKAKKGLLAAKATAVGAGAAVVPKPPPRLHAAAQATALSSNWEVLKQTVGATGEGLKRKREAEEALAAAGGKRPSSKGTSAALTPVIAMDCEMVGVGRNGERSALARVAIINNDGNVLLDEYVKPKERITDYRTRWSGIRPADLHDAPPFDEVIGRVAALLKGRIIVGHALHNDLAVLMLGHPKKDIRDTARYPPLMRAGAVGRKPKPQALRMLAAAQLGLCIQEGEHTPVDDARAALYLYHKHHKEWEAALARGTLRFGPTTTVKAMANTTVTKVVSKAGEAVRTRVVKSSTAAVPGAVSAGRAVAGAGQTGRQAGGKPAKRLPGSDPFSRSVFDDPMADL